MSWPISDYYQGSSPELEKVTLNIQILVADITRVLPKNWPASVREVMFAVSNRDRRLTDMQQNVNTVLGLNPDLVETVLQVFSCSSIRTQKMS
jgi:hypothetical protein